MWFTRTFPIQKQQSALCHNHKLPDKNRKSNYPCRIKFHISQTIKTLSCQHYQSQCWLKDETMGKNTLQTRSTRRAHTSSRAIGSLTPRIILFLSVNEFKTKIIKSPFIQIAIQCHSGGGLCQQISIYSHHIPRRYPYTVIIFQADIRIQSSYSKKMSI